MWISDLSIRRPVFAVMLIAALVGLGAVSVGRLGVNLYPEVEFPFVTIQTILPGASPETMETEVSDILEEEINTISGVRSLRSESLEGVSTLGVEFELTEDANVKIQDVRDKVGRALNRLPRDVEAPVISRYDADSAPILSIMISGDISIKDLTSFSKNVIKERIQRVAGVGSVSLVGGREREIRIWLDANKLRSFQITAEEVIAAIRREHAEIPGGRLDTAGRLTELSVKTRGEVTNVADFGNIVVMFRKGRPTYIRDVARVQDGLEDERTYAELDGRTGVSLEVRRQSGENTVEVAHAIKKEVEKLKATLPGNIDLVVAQDISLFIEASANDVREDIIVGIILVVMVTLAFLVSVRATIIVAVAMPTAMISTFFALYIFDFSINTLTLVAISLSVGLLVDDAIVVLESIHRKVEAGIPRLRAASEGVKEVGAAVFAGTISVCAVFVPIAFMQGVVGKFFFEYGLTIVFAVLVSLLVSITLTPAMCSRFLKKTTTRGPVAEKFEAGFDGLAAFYRKILQVCIAKEYKLFDVRLGKKSFSCKFSNRLVVFSATILLLAIGIAVASTLPFAFDVPADRSEFKASVELPFGTGIEKSKIVGQRVASQISTVEHVERVFMTIGANARGNVNDIGFYIALTPKAKRPVDAWEIMQKTRIVIHDAAPEARSITVADIPSIGGGGMGTEIMMALKGRDLDELQDASQLLVNQMRRSGSFVDVQSTFKVGKPEVQFTVDRPRAADLGVSVMSIANTIRTMVGGMDVSTFEEDGERFDVRVQLEEEQRNELAQLNLIQVRGARKQAVDLANVTSYSVEASASQINRRDRTRSITITSNLPPGVALGDASETLEHIVSSLGLPSSVEIKPIGKAEMMEETKGAIFFAVLMALVALYMILASQFNSFVQPGIIMMTAPLSFIGAFIALGLTDGIVSLFTQIALVALMGLVMKNGILLVDYANKLRRDDPALDAVSAMIQAAPVRLRPVLMTAISTISGMIPVALSTSQGAEFRNAMGIVVIGGLASSTFLTLIVVPASYCTIAVWGENMRKALSSKNQVKGPGSSDAAVSVDPAH